MAPRGRQWLKMIGAAGLAGVAASGILAARSERRRRSYEPDEIRERLLYPMINEGAKILDEKMAQRPGDIDTVWLNGYGWPAWTGGIMYWADHEGLGKIVDGLKRHNLPVAPLLEKLAAEGGKFSA